jgi:hypothetical protein
MHACPWEYSFVRAFPVFREGFFSFPDLTLARTATIGESIARQKAVLDQEKLKNSGSSLSVRVERLRKIYPECSDVRIHFHATLGEVLKVVPAFCFAVNGAANLEGLEMRSGFSGQVVEFIRRRIVIPQFKPSLSRPYAVHELWCYFPRIHRP